MLYVRRTNGTDRRIGFSISKKLGDATDRNRIKRRLREAVRARMPGLVPGFDAVFVGRVRMKGAPFSEAQKAVDELFRRAKLLKPPEVPESLPCNRSGES